MDRNTIIGFVLIGALLIAMFAINSNERQKWEKAQIVEQKKKDSIRQADSIKNAKLNPQPVVVAKDSIIPAAPVAADALQDSTLTHRQYVMENDLMSIHFDNKGGTLKSVLLKKFKNHQNQQIVLGDLNYSGFTYDIEAGQGRTIASEKLLFNVDTTQIGNKTNPSITFYLQDSTGKRTIQHHYSIKPLEYLVNFELSFDDAAQRLGKKNSLDLVWRTQYPKAEEDSQYELSQAHACYKENDEFGFDNMIRENKSMNFNLPTDWIAFKQQFFIQGIIAKNKFKSAHSDWNLLNEAPGNTLAKSNVNLHCELNQSQQTVVPLQLYMGPSDYHELLKHGNDLEKIVPYGSGIFAFVKYINRHFLLPVFDFLNKHIMSMGIVVLLLTLFIRLLTSPILYKSYLSGAKMKMLKPEIDALKEKHKDDQQAFGMEQMKLWKSAGVNPLGGCIPALLQIPIFMSLYYFFQANIDLRGVPFLWAKDLSQYDTILNFSFHIPVYGDHVSLFTLTAVITSLLISLYGMSNMQDNSNPMMKYMPYIFPVLLLGVFNNLPAALTWYYTISNTITLILQIVIQKYIINHDKIMEEIKENMKKPVKKSKLQERMEAMQESQRKLQELKNKKSS